MATRAIRAYHLVAILLLLAPLFLAGRAPLGLMVLQLLCLIILVHLCWQHNARLTLPGTHKLALLLLLSVPLLQILPLPMALIDALPGRQDHLTAKLLSSRGHEGGLAVISVCLRESLAAWLILLLPATTYVAVRQCSTVEISKLILLVWVGAAMQAILGLLQFGGGVESPLYFGMERAHFGSAIGTYTSRNNFVGYLYLALMTAVAAYMANLGRQRRFRGSLNLRQRLVHLASPQGHKATLLGAYLLLLLLAIVFSRSRAGIGLAILGVLISTMLFARRIGGDNVYGRTGSLIAIAGGLAVAVGLTPVLDRFSATDPLSSGRWTIFQGTWQAIGDFMPTGSGAGTFRATFFPFQDLSQASFTINRAHNDYLEWIYTGGLPAAALIVFLLALYIGRWPRLWIPQSWGEFRYLQIGAGIGMLLMLLHEFVDYNLMTPANMILFAFFSGVFFHDYREPEPRSRSGQGLEPDRVRDPRSRPQLESVPATPTKNPFHD